MQRINQHNAINISLKHKYLLLLLFILSQYPSALCQTLLSGTVVDSNSKIPLPFVNIGIEHKNIGTTSQKDGFFSINIPLKNQDDTLTFSLVGYDDLRMAVKEIISSNTKYFALPIKSITLSNITISASRLVEKNFGIEKNNALIHFTDGSTNQKDIFEIAQLMKFDTSLSKITAVNLFIDEPGNEPVTFRINFYAFDGNMPGNKIVEKNIVQTHEMKAGWLKFDLSDQNIYLRGNFIVSIEFIPSTNPDKTAVYYEIKLGGGAKSFVRTSSQGTWGIPPHHYRMFVTALVPDNKKYYNTDNDEKETVPTTSLYSAFVKDSFFLFIQTPAEYEKKKNQNYPVIFLLDANAYFDIVANAMNEKSIAAILVGVGYKDVLQMDSLRQRDYTFPVALVADSFSISGGANQFLRFFENELLPYIDTTYRTDKSNRTIMGHSLGGYFALFMLLTELKDKTNYFKNFVAASPSLDYYHQYLLQQFQNITEIENAKRSVLLTTGEKEKEEKVESNAIHSDSFTLLVKQLTATKFNSINTYNIIYPGAEHMATAVPTFTQSLQIIK
ncbi:MAG: alpha/beta hydrolase-fold protein [Chitinophagales bacterium]